MTKMIIVSYQLQKKTKNNIEPTKVYRKLSL